MIVLVKFVGITDNLDIPLDNLGQHGLPLFGLSDKTISLEVQSFYLGTSKGSSLSLVSTIWKQGLILVTRTFFDCNMHRT